MTKQEWKKEYSELRAWLGLETKPSWPEPELWRWYAHTMYAHDPLLSTMQERLRQARRGCPFLYD